MRKLLLVLSAIGCFVALVVYWFCGIWTGLIATLLLGALIALGIYLIKINARWWLVILFIVITFFAIKFSFSSLSTRNAVKDLDVVTQNETETVIENDEDKIQIEDEDEEDTDVSEIGNGQLCEGEKVSQSKPETTPEPTVVTKTEYVEKVVEKRVEVPVEKEVIKEVVVEKEVPVVEYVEVEKESEVSASIQTSTPNYNYNSQYYGDPTASGNYAYGYNYGYYGDPTGDYSNYSSISVKGKTTVTAGNSYTYTILGVNSISRSKLTLPSNVSVENISGNRVTLYFDEDWTGTYSIGYGSAVIKVKVTADE